jgi:hypothetical protein
MSHRSSEPTPVAPVGQPRRRPRGALLAIVAVLATSMAGAAPAFAGGEGDVSRDYLMVSDGAASRVYFYRVPSMKLTGALSGVTLGSTADPAATPMHGGAIFLPDGRILVNDETHQRTLAIKLDGEGAPHIVQSVASTLGGEAPWSAVDPDFRYYAVSSNGGGTLGPAPAPGGFQTGTEILNIIDLKSFENTRLEIAMNNTGEDLTPFFGARPLTLFAGVGGGEMRVYRVARLLEGDTTPTSTATMGPNSHGGFSSPVTDRIGITTGPQPPSLGSGPTAIPNPDNLGMNVFDIACEHHKCRQPALSNPFVVPWNADGLTLGKGNRVRMMADGAHVLTPLNVDLTPGVLDDWQDVRLDAHVTDLRTSSARRATVGVGGTSRGFPMSQRYAVEPVIRPLAAGGMDQLKIIDIRPGSPRYLRIVRSVELPQMTRGPVAGVNPVFPTYERRFAAITPAGRYAFVSRGGDAEVDMVDTATGALTRVAVPSPLSGGGHIDAFHVGFRPFELSGR